MLATTTSSSGSFNLPGFDAAVDRHVRRSASIRAARAVGSLNVARDQPLRAPGGRRHGAAAGVINVTDEARAQNS